MLKKIIFIFFAIIGIVFFTMQVVEKNEMKYDDITGTWIDKETDEKVIIKYKNGYLYFNDKELEILTTENDDGLKVESFNKVEEVTYTFRLEKKDEYLIVLCELNDAALKPIELVKTL